jgi:Uma2 family endonuclease
MAEQTGSVVSPAGEVVAAQVSAEEYMERYAADHYEWVKGVVIKMTPVSLKHDSLRHYLRQLLDAYFSLNPIGVVIGEPFVMRLETTDSYREPDLQVLLNTNPSKLTDTALLGPADICIEVVSPESVARDYGEKFEEYEKGGVGEYWIIDPAREVCHFYRLQESKLYTVCSPDEQGFYRTPRLPHLVLHIPTLWQEKLPDFFAIGQAVQEMIEKNE